MDIQTIQKLRQQTGAGMVDCQKALAEANGDYEKAVDILRKKGEAKAAKKADRATKEGLISIARQDDKVAVVSLACETDFVAKNQEFIQAVDDYAQKLFSMPVEEFRQWAADDIKRELVVKIGENIQLKDAELFDQAKVIGFYLHSNKKMAAVVVLNDEGDIDLATDLAMQVVAMSPDYISVEDVPAEEIEKEKEVYRAQLEQEGKPEEIIDKIVAGKINKYYEDVCLLKQPFIKDDKMSVENYIKSKGEAIKVLKFSKFVL